MPGLLDYIPSQSDVQRTIADLLAKPRNRLRGLLSDPSGFLQSALSDVVPTDQQAQEQLARYRMPLSQDYAMGPSGYDNKMQDIALGALTVYHGSPHKFDKFDMSKIGSGEGAQAYGHGLYFAESPDVAQSYKNALSNTLESKVDAPQLEKRAAQMALTFGDNTAEGAINWLNKFTGKGAAHTSPAMTPELVESVKNRFINGDFYPGGAFYKVDIPDEAIPRMLDWDKPLSQQAPEVQKALNGMRNLEGSQLHSMLIHKYGSPDKVNDFLRQQGIPGIRYLDGGSRNAGQGTYNYVVFDDTLPTILERNGQKLK